MRRADRNPRPSPLAIAYLIASLSFAFVAAALLSLANCDPRSLL